MRKVAKEYVGIVRNDDVSLHVFRLAEDTEAPYVVGFNLNFTDQNTATWDNGIYCKSLDEAWVNLDDKCVEHGFKLSV